MPYAHEDHFGLVKTKQLIREKVWFPGVDNLTSDVIANCIACQATVPAKQSRDPYNMSPFQEEPWTDVSLDFKVLSDSEYLVITGDYSRYPVVEIMKSTAAKVVIPALDKVLAEFGVQRVVNSDNGSPFQSDDFHTFANYLGFKHRRITPYWPRSNAECERFMKTRKVRQSRYSRRRFLQTESLFIPTELLCHTTCDNRCQPWHCAVPEMSVTVPDDTMRQRDDAVKEKMRRDADIKLPDNRSHLDLGDKVLIRNRSKGTLEPLYSAHPHNLCEGFNDNS